MIEDGTYQVADFMEELKAMVNEIVHFVRYSSAKTITVETPEEKDGEDKKTKREKGERRKNCSCIEMPQMRTRRNCEGKNRLGMYPIPEIL